MPLETYPRITLLLRAVAQEIDDPAPSAAYLEPLVNALTALCAKCRLIVSTDSLLRAYLEYIEENMRSIRSVRQISDAFGYSEGYFLRLFRRLSGFTPHQYLIGCRMREAARLIREGLSLESVAEGVGYPGAKSLGGAFTAYYGIPPKRYRTLIIHP